MNLVKKICVALAVLIVVSAPALANEKKPAEAVAQPAVSAAPFFGPAIGAGLGAGLVIIGAALGFGRIGGSALESMARQPETANKVQTAMIIIGALLEGATFFALIICIQLAGKA